MIIQLGFGAQGAAGDPKPQMLKLGFGAKDAAGDPQLQTFGYHTLVPEFYDRTYILGGWGEGLLRFAVAMSKMEDAT